MSAVQELNIYVNLMANSEVRQKKEKVQKEHTKKKGPWIIFMKYLMVADAYAKYCLTMTRASQATADRLTYNSAVVPQEEEKKKTVPDDELTFLSDQPTGRQRQAGDANDRGAKIRR